MASDGLSRIASDRVPADRWTDRIVESTGPGGSTVGERDLADRAALRRVAGLSTELSDITEVEYRRLQLERVVLVGVWSSGSAADAEASMRELSLLAETAGSVVLDAVVQRRSSPDAATYIGSGKVIELAEVVTATGADTVICDGELSPGQLRNLEERLKVKVVDRTALILDIFAQHARSKEGKAQVELAQLNYLVPRLRGWGAALSRQRGGRVAAGAGIGSRGPGETKLEIDRRRIHKRIAQLKRELSDMGRVRDTKRSSRQANAIPAVAIAGYTNAGKSSLLNRLTDAGVLVEDALFATLDPTTRRSRTEDGRVFTLTDTVGFVRHLPHQLVESFRSTLEEIADADLVLHVVDGSDAQPEEQVSAVREVLAEIDATKVPEIIVVNKIDAADPGDTGSAAPRAARRVLRLRPHRAGHPGVAGAARRCTACPAGPCARAGAVHGRIPGLSGARRGHGVGRGTHRRWDAADRPRSGGAGRRAGSVRRGRQRLNRRPAAVRRQFPG